jgi:hypothetical protein
MPSAAIPYTSTYRSVNEFPPELWQALREHALDANVIYPHASKRKMMESGGHDSLDNEVWITYTSYQNGQPSIDLILSVTENEVNKYPVFIIATHPFHRLLSQADFFESALHMLAETLAKEVDHRRVFSVFGPNPLSIPFSHSWTKLTGISAELEPYYAAKFTYCKNIPQSRKYTQIPGLRMDLRQADERDREGVARLCFQFASESVGL